MRHTVIVVCLLALLAAPAVAQDGPASRDYVSETKLWEAMRAGKWRDALVAYNGLSLPQPKHAFLAAQAHYNLTELNKSADVLGDVIEKNPEHIAALYMLARIRARQLRWDDARTLLGSCARLGQSVLRDMSAPEDRKAFGPLLEDSYFIVSIMRMSGGWRPDDGFGGRDPFQPPAEGTRPPVDPKDPVVLERVDGLIQEIEGLLRAFDELSRGPSPDVEELVAKLRELTGALDRLSAIEHPAVPAALARFRAEVARFKGLINPLQLHLYVADGNQHLRAMANHLSEREYEETIERFAQLEELVEQMRSEPLEAFGRSAEALYVRGKRLVERASRQLAASKLVLDVTGIVVAPSPEPCRAVINDTIYEEGDAVLDPETGEPIRGLTVEGIGESAVTFLYDGLRFVRALKER